MKCRLAVREVRSRRGRGQGPQNRRAGHGRDQRWHERIDDGLPIGLTPADRPTQAAPRIAPSQEVSRCRAARSRAGVRTSREAWPGAAFDRPKQPRWCPVGTLLTRNS